MLHWCFMCGRIATIFVLFLMTDNLCFTGVVCLLGLRICLFSYPWLIIYASQMLYIWLDCDNFVLFPMIDNLCFTGVVCLVGLQLLFHCYLWLIIYFSLVLYCLVGWRLFLYFSLLLIIYAWLVLHVCSDCDYFSTIPYDW